MNKKKVISIISFLIIAIGILFIFTGGKRTDVVLRDFEISEDGTKITLRTMVTSSAGYTRKLKVKQGGDNKYITFYSTYGINNSIGAKDKFEIEINPSCEEIYFYAGDYGYRLVLQKEENEWKKVN